MSLDRALEEEHVATIRNPRLHLDLYADDQEREMKRSIDTRNWSDPASENL